MIALGIDEAGRGPLIGPMIIAGLCFRSEDLRLLRELGVRDSKLLSPQAREKLFDEIMKLAQRKVIYKISAREIDEAVFSSLKITGLEAKYMAKIVEETDPEAVYIDSPLRDTSKFLSLIKLHLKKDYQIVCEIKADLKYVQVAAASIVAKVIRDSEIKELHKKYGDFGSGYPSDPRTIAFVKRMIEKGVMIEEIRRSWKSLKKLGT